VEVSNTILSLAVLARAFHGMSAEDSSMLARKAVDVAGPDADEIDLLDALDDVWAASILARTVSLYNANPIHPLSLKERSVFWELDEHEKEHIIINIPDEEYPIPKRYKDIRLVASNKNTSKTRRHWDI
jgi:hypothetical protein